MQLTPPGVGGGIPPGVEGCWLGGSTVLPPGVAPRTPQGGRRLRAPEFFLLSLDLCLREFHCFVPFGLVVVKEAGRCVRGTGFALDAPQSPPLYIKNEYFKSVRCGGRNRRAAMLSLALILLAQMSFRKKICRVPYLGGTKSGDCPQLVS